MGGSESLGHLHVQLETYNIQAGQAVTGVIHCQLQQAIAANSLNLKFSGKEFCSWSESSSDSDGGTTSATISGKAVVVKQIYPVFAFPGGTVAPGQFSFPFAFNTHPMLPGSFEYTYRDADARIRYSVTAFFSSKVKVSKSKAILHITKPMTESISAVHGTLATPISTWCCCSQGTVQVTAHINKSAYVPGETAEIEAEVDNRQGRIDMRAITGTLYRTLRLRDQFGRPNIFRIKLNESYVSERILAGEKREGGNRVKMLLRIFDVTGGLQNATTVRGQKIECIYTVSITAVMDGSCMCCGQTPAVERELVIYPLQLVPMAPPPAPAGWHPMVMPAAQLGSDPSAPPLPSQV